MVYPFCSPPQDIFFFSVIISMWIIITDFKCLELFPFCAVSLFKIKSMLITKWKHKKAEAKSQIYTNKPIFIFSFHDHDAKPKKTMRTLNKYTVIPLRRLYCVLQTDIGGLYCCILQSSFRSLHICCWYRSHICKFSH